jgi:heterodisulfide reductase subunit A
MYATKEAVMAKEHDPETEVHIFMMDMRSFSKGYYSYYNRAKDQYGIEYTRCRVSELKEDPETGKLSLKYVRDQGSGNGKHDPGQPFTLQSPISSLYSDVVEEEFDLVVLSVGMEISESVRNLGGDLGIELDEYGFCHTTLFNPLETSREGIFVAGPFREPKDIPETVVEASGAAARSASMLSASRHTLTQISEYPPERDVAEEPVKTGVFVCHCGSNIGGFINIDDVVDHAKQLPGVIHAEQNLYTCSQDSIAHITEQVKELGLNRVVVASCTPHTHGALFQDCIRTGGLNPALFDMANIRNQCSWVHSQNKDTATTKAKDLVRMATARAATLEPLTTTQVEIEHSGLVVGGGVAGMTTALELAKGGFEVSLVEREKELGGNLRDVYRTASGDDPQEFLTDLIKRVQEEPKITILLEHEIADTRGFKGKFTTRIKGPAGEKNEIKHGVTILATGGEEYHGEEYEYGTSPTILTGLEFEALLATAEGKEPRLIEKVRPAQNVIGKNLPDEVAIIHCVGPADRYCSRICCTTALKNALALKELNPEARITILYQDIRTYGFKEDLYTKARELGIRFIRYEPEDKPEVQFNGEGIHVKTHDHALGIPLTLQPEILVLSNPIVPSEGAHQLASTCKTAVDGDGFFLEAHVKLRPVDFATDGLYMAGMAHYPKLMDETIAHAQAAASRASVILSKETLTAGGIVAEVDSSKCVACLTCVRVCPFDVPMIDESIDGNGDIPGAAYIEPTICQGCGTCVSECPAKAIDLLHYQDDQIMIKLDALLAGV